MNIKSIKLFSLLSAGQSRMDTRLDRWGAVLERKSLHIYPGIAGSIIFLSLSVLILLLMPLQIKVRADQSITARTFPAILAFIMMGGALINLCKDLLRLCRRKALQKISLNLLTELKALILLLLLIFYALLMPLIGFSSASAIYGILMLFYFRIRDWRYYLLVSVLAMGIGFLFKDLLNVRLP